MWLKQIVGESRYDREEIDYVFVSLCYYTEGQDNRSSAAFPVGGSAFITGVPGLSRLVQDIKSFETAAVK